MNLKGLVYIAIGASSYGVLATFVKLANQADVHTASLTFSQYITGLVILTILNQIFKNKSELEDVPKQEIFKARKNLILYGTSLGVTSSLYYLSIRYVPVSVAVVLLMQSVWLGLVFEAFMNRNAVTKRKIIGAVFVIIGTLLAVNLIEEGGNLDWRGLVLGFLAAISFTVTMATTQKVGLVLGNLERSLYLVLGGLLAILIFWNIQIFQHFAWQDLVTWGLFLGVFGTILPPILFNQGFPKVGVGMGSIVASIELPISVFSAYILLKEPVLSIQWIGIAIILASIVWINLKQKNT